ncbi:hypothetical protein [Kordiimonas lacus]|uniref:Uncharacterized protein n=1 Tax=Kordiimonas lacus TaxID=637679 RepID=A0A1G7CBY1_9PROT|nr:hypothetical protein [Kordiimonas lacus]SDE36743.1 hypothetical protein SAMN04488071_2737 [Kordiimonas lacus]
MKTVPHRRHRHSEGPGHYKWVIAGLATVGLLHLCYLIAGEFFTGLGGALLTIWIILPMIAGLKVGARGVMQGGMPAFVGTFLLTANYGFPYVGYTGWQEPLAIPILLVAPAIHGAFIFGLSVLISAVERR